MKTMVFGASPKPYRYSHRVTLMLQQNGFKVVPVGIHPGIIGTLPIAALNKKPFYPDIHTITMYLNQVNQREWYQYILQLKPKRVIFNPGSENSQLSGILAGSGIYFEEGCTLVMLSTGSFELV